MRLLMAASTAASGSCRNSLSACKAGNGIERGMRPHCKHRVEHLGRGAVGTLEQHSAESLGDEVINLIR